ncbi:MAG: TonB-dependent receptor [Candidatus Marinimicrobia bacterium]|nr:TonB-dependent receptor [Candidatus Neomarinimicrobiota bacterium]
MTRNNLTILAFLLYLFLTNNLFAGTSGKISGIVIDAGTKEPLIGCNVIVVGTSLGAATDINGEFFILNVPPGTYSVKAMMIGYTPIIMKDLEVVVDLTSRADFNLSMEVIAGQTVTIIAEKPTVRLDQTSMAAVVGTKQIDNLPVAEVGDIIELQAGIVRDAGGGLHVRGGRSGEVSFWVDGISTTDSYDGSSVGEEVQNSSIQELQVISGTFNAEYGNAMSGIVNVVTKDGGNKLDGGLEIYGGGYHTYDNEIFTLSSPFTSWIPFSDLDGDGVWDQPEWFNDKNGNLQWDPGEPFDDENGNGVWDAGEPLNSDLGADGQLGDPLDNGSMVPSNVSNNNGQKNEPSIGEGNGTAQWGEHRFTLEENGYVEKLNSLLNPFQIQNLNAHLSGPLLGFGDKLTFYINVRYFKTMNRFYGKNLFLPNGSWGNENGNATGKADVVPLAPFSKLTGQLKLTFKPLPKVKMAYSLFYSEKSYKNYDSFFKYNPQGLMNRFEEDLTHIVTLTHTLSPKTFYELKYIDFSSSYWEYLYKDLTNVPYEKKNIDDLSDLFLYNYIAVIDTVISDEGDTSYFDVIDTLITVNGDTLYENQWEITIVDTLLEDHFIIDSTLVEVDTLWTLDGDIIYHYDWLYTVVDSGDVEGYVDPDIMNVPAWSFAPGGTQDGRYERRTTYDDIKFDLSSQINRYNQIKTGFEIKRYDLWAEEKSVQYKTYGDWGLSSQGDTLGFNPLAGAQIEPYTPTILPTHSTSHNYFRANPLQFSAYIQDKLELDDIILNIGLRFDYFDPDWIIPKDYRFPGNEKYYLVYTPNDTVIFWEHEYSELHPQVTIYDSLTAKGSVKAQNLLNLSISDDSSWSNVRENYRWVDGYKKAPASYQVSPRIGLSYPITDKGAIHVSYGYFFQIPNFYYLYANPEFEIGESSFAGILGNAALKPERTVMYEVGVKQEIFPFTSFDFTIFYRDTRDWVGMSAPINKYPVGTYRKYENKDYSNTRGYTITIHRSYINGFGASLDYSWMVAEGTYSNPDDAYHSAQNDESPLQSLIPLEWDQTHTLNGSLTLGGRDWSASLILKYWSGMPYTPEFKVGTVAGATAFSGFAENSDRKPNFFTVDLRSSYQLNMFGLRFMLFCNIYNLLDIRNEQNVWNDTGRATYTLTAKDVPNTSSDRIGHLKEHLLQPDRFSEPRKINIGFNIDF